MAASSAGFYAIESIRISLDVLEDVSCALPAPVGVVVKLTKRIIGAAETMKSNREICGQLRDRLLRLMLVIIKLVKQGMGASADRATLPSDLKNNIQQLQTNLESILQEVEKIQSTTTSRRKRHKLAAFFLGQSHAAALKKCVDDLEWAMGEFSVSSHLSDAVRLWGVSLKVSEVSKDISQVSKNVSEGFRRAQRSHTNQFLRSLPRAKYAAFDCERPDQPSSCFKGTRTAILETVFDWVLNTDPEIPHFYWMKGIAGVGKTTIARTIAELARNAGVLGGQFFFSRQGEAELRNPALVFPTIAYQLARFDPEFCERITAAIEADPDLAYASLKQQLEGLIVNPLAGLERDPERVVVIVFDAFDECETQGAKQILQLLVAAMPRLPFFLKILVTSRPEQHIRSVLVPSANLHMTALHDIEESIVKADIKLYLRARLRGLPAERGIDLPPDWVKDSEIDIIAEKADTLFIHVETCRRFLSDALDPRRQLDELLEIITSGGSASDANPFAHLDQLYIEILRKMVNKTNGAEVVATHQAVLGAIILLRDPLPVAALERLLGPDSPKASRILPLLHSVVLPPSSANPCPRIYHPSFPDFLQDARRCSDERFRVDTKSHEARMALLCLELMNEQLHMWMLGDMDPSLLNAEVVDLASKVQEAFPPELQYACRYWASHLVKASESDDAVATALETFAAKSLLPWVEAMSWLGETRLCLTSFEGIIAWATRRNVPPVTKNLLHDSHRLLLLQFPNISVGAQHITRSIIQFLPHNSELFSRYKQYADPTITILRGADFEWPASLMTLSVPHTGLVLALMFSSDNSRLASGSLDQTIGIWDTITGSFLASLTGHSGDITSVAFSPGDSHLASGSTDSTIRVWDPTTGLCLAILEGHAETVHSVAFSPNGVQVASGSADGTILVWDTATWSCSFQLESPTDVYSVAFSADSTCLAWGSDDWVVQVWDVPNMKSLVTLEGHSGSVYGVVFSPTDSSLASGSGDQTVRIWNVATATCTATLQGHTSRVISLSFSLDGSRLASGSSDKTVRIWDPTKGTCLINFHGHFSRVTSVAFSPDGLRVASAASDHIRIWDTSPNSHPPNLETPSDPVEAVSLSPDGTRLASTESSSAGHIVQVRDVMTDEYLLTLEGHSEPVESVAFSLDGTQIASGSRDSTIRVWDSSTGSCWLVLSANGPQLRCVVFSPEGTRLASGDTMDTLRIWDLIRGDCLSVFECPPYSVGILAYSPDGSRLVSGGRDDTSYVWDAISGACLATLPNPQVCGMISVSFSPNGSFILTNTLLPNMVVWDALEYVPIDQKATHVAHEAGNTTRSNYIHFEDCRLVRVDPSGIKHLICLIPPAPCVASSDFVEVAPHRYRIAWGCGEGRIIIFDLSL